jgi:hypothetical protein
MADGQSQRISKTSLIFPRSLNKIAVFQHVACDRLFISDDVVVGKNDIVMGHGSLLNPLLLIDGLLDLRPAIAGFRPRGKPDTIGPIPPEPLSPRAPLALISWRLTNCVNSTLDDNFPNYNGSPWGYGCDLEPVTMFLDDYLGPAQASARMASVPSNDSESKPVSVPEPSAMGTLLAVGAWCGASWHKRKRQESEPTSSDV